ncbi:glycosyltransferase family 9 protein [Parvibium lacunae]|uniref:Lipopolysaccharide heptosyltransferase family protein n=1 Tax=Parvibium lacunae TaxID=1888893 RepID=A0A368L414_9BURK|nr:glycosyltransferase family 9 protein [Parvibium lacunae]RCS58314.1 lipopolysaccharide heptosyltransferase family protein [Parvibium lacunae]
MKKILIVRRDNIGDLVCTLPLLEAIKAQEPDSQLYAYVNRYNAPILQHYVSQHARPDPTKVLAGYWAYQKDKHRLPGETRLGIFWQRWKQAQQMRQHQFDWVLLAGGINDSTLRWAQWLKPTQIVRQDQLAQYAGAHEVERTCSLLTALGLPYQTPVATLRPDSATASLLASTLPAHLPVQRVAIHISARKPSQRWPVGHFIELANTLAAQGLGVLLFWAPGSAQDPTHPGDDDKLRHILAQCDRRHVVPVRTDTLSELIAGLDLAQSVICADGGAMHVAAALGKPIVALFGDSEASRWHPWGVPHVVLQDPARDVQHLTVSQVFTAWQGLLTDGAVIKPPIG